MPNKRAPVSFNYETKKPSFGAILEHDFCNLIVEGLKKKAEQVAEEAEIVDTAQTFMAGLGKKGPDPEDPLDSGWTFLINKKDSVGVKIIEAIKELAIHRKMDEPDSPLLFNDTPRQAWRNWIDSYYKNWKKGEHETPPRYVLIIGGPNEIPMDFQSLLSTVACVGRIDFDDDIAKVETYAKKVKRIEETNIMINDEVAFFAPDHDTNKFGCLDPTHYSRIDIEDFLIPVVDGLVVKETKYNAFPLVVDKATKQDLLNHIRDIKPCVVYVSCWGLSAPNEKPAFQKEYTGAICCQGDYATCSDYDSLLLTAKDIPDTPFFEGGIIIQQSGFGYGTPAISDLSHWLPDEAKWGVPKQVAQVDFIASLPKKLVFHPQGPLAFVGHYDELLSYSYPKSEDNKERRKVRIDPIKNAIKGLLNVHPVGHAFREIPQIYAGKCVDITGFADALHQQGEELDEKQKLDLSEAFLECNNTRNYLIFGDPAVTIQHYQPPN